MALVGGLTLAAGPLPAARADGGPVARTEWPVTATDLYDRPSNNSPVLAADPTDRRFVVLANRLDAPFNCALQASGDAGRTWVTALPVRKLPKGADTCYGPEVAFDRQGVLYYLFVGLAGGGNSPMGVFLTTSTDRARTFSPPRKILGAERYMVRMALDPSVGSLGRLHLVWLEAGSKPPSGGQVLVAAVAEGVGGRSFGRHVSVSDRSFDAGIGFGSERGMPDLGSRLALDSSGDRVLAVWTDTRAETVASSKEDLAWAVIRVDHRPAAKVVLVVLAAVGLMGACAVAATTRRPRTVKI